jgi:lipoyl(octanoyl) transferase
MNIHFKTGAILLPRDDAAPAAFSRAAGLTPYPDALAFMEERVRAIAEGSAGELVWLVEHPPSTPPAPARASRTWSSPAAFPSSTPGAAGNTPITAPASAWPI